MLLLLLSWRSSNSNSNGGSDAIAVRISPWNIFAVRFAAAWALLYASWYLFASSCSWASLSFGRKIAFIQSESKSRANSNSLAEFWLKVSASYASSDARVPLSVWHRLRYRHRQRHQHRLWLLLQAADKRRLTARTLNGVPLETEPEPISRHLYFAFVFISPLYQTLPPPPLLLLLLRLRLRLPDACAAVARWLTWCHYIWQGRNQTGLLAAFLPKYPVPQVDKCMLTSDLMFVIRTYSICCSIPYENHCWNNNWS